MKRHIASIALVLGAAAALVPASDQAGLAARELRIAAGRSAVIDFPADIARISTSSPEVVDAVAVSMREVLLHAKSMGTATVVVWSKNGQRAFYQVWVEPNLEPLRELLKKTFPGENIQVEATRDSLALTGTVSSQAVADRAAVLVAPVSKAVVNNLVVAPAKPDPQVLLRVRFAELNRSALDALGVNLVSTGALNTPGSVTTGQFPAPRASQLEGGIPGRLEGTQTRFSLSDTLNVFAFRPDLNLAVFLRALESQGLLQILAEPNLVAANGKEASFLVGGEFPIPVVQGGANVGAVTIQFREFGIRLTFQPQITPLKTIKMMVRPEVSTIDMANALVFSGFTIPALATRRMETHVELAPGQSFVIAGLIDDRVTETLAKVPGLADIPLLGALFKSRQRNRTKTELLVIVSPEITQPLEAGQPLPGPPMPREFLPPAGAPKAAPGKPAGTAHRKGSR
ncbi:MAG: type II and III secretion system protein family protein [Bryobacteraceae bacterium]